MNDDLNEIIQNVISSTNAHTKIDFFSSSLNKKKTDQIEKCYDQNKIENSFK